MWEFPGGKIGRDELPVTALGRELAEELGIELVSAAEFTRLEHRYPDRHVSIRFFLVEAWRNEPSGLEGQRLRWLPAVELAGANLLPADAPVIEALLRL
jgi:8-oxo-dGTP diphosphatase